MSGRFAAVILAGGRGERLGGTVKANVTVGGTRLLERVSRALGTRAEAVLVATGAFDSGAAGLLAGQIGIPDLPAGHVGPLAGVVAGIDWCNRAAQPPDLILTVAVDTPFLPADFAARMIAALADSAAAVVAGHAGQDYPTNALWRLSAVADLPLRSAAGTAPRSLRRLAAELGATVLDWPASDGGDPFANVNTPADLLALERRAARRG